MKKISCNAHCATKCKDPFAFHSGCHQHRLCWGLSVWESGLGLMPELLKRKEGRREIFQWWTGDSWRRDRRKPGRLQERKRNGWGVGGWCYLSRRWWMWGKRGCVVPARFPEKEEPGGKASFRASQCGFCRWVGRTRSLVCGIRPRWHVWVRLYQMECVSSWAQRQHGTRRSKSGPFSSYPDFYFNSLHEKWAPLRCLTRWWVWRVKGDPDEEVTAAPAGARGCLTHPLERVWFMSLGEWAFWYWIQGCVDWPILPPAVLDKSGLLQAQGLGCHVYTGKSDREHILWGQTGKRENWKNAQAMTPLPMVHLTSHSSPPGRGAGGQGIPPL